jgi:hypothetical protein
MAVQHESMTPSTDKAYMDAKSDALEAGQKGWMLAHEARMDARFAAFTTEMERKFSDMTRWVVGIVLGTTALTMSFMTFLIVHVAPKLIPAPSAPSPTPPATAPAVIYVIPALPVAPPSAPKKP